MGKTFAPLWKSLGRGIRALVSRPEYVVALIVVPLVAVWFFDSLLSRGVTTRVPVAIVDLDQSEMSRAITRNLDVQQVLDITAKCESYEAAIDLVRQGKIFGFFTIPDNFEQDVFAGNNPTLNFYSNLTYFVPGTYSYKGFKAIAVATASSVIRDMAVSRGVPESVLEPLVQPVSLQINQINNPWANYAYYLGPSFTYGTLQLMILLLTIFSITMEIKDGTSPQWLRTGGNSILVSLTGKLLPQTVIFTIVGWAVMAVQFGFNHYPMNGSLAIMLIAMALTVVACQSLGVFYASLLPNPRLALSLGALTGILAFSLAGFSFPVQNMYGGIAIFSYILPVRYLFLTYIGVALNGVDPYYVRYDLIALVLFIPVGLSMVWNLKRMCKHPVYIP
ncbi:MAG: ABC transporter permease [Muribaculaceae bacterium]|nr:ABC transporter permease [Muribaculaceae bacterium]